MKKGERGDYAEFREMLMLLKRGKGEIGAFRIRERRKGRLHCVEKDLYAVGEGKRSVKSSRSEGNLKQGKKVMLR